MCVKLSPGELNLTLAPLTKTLYLWSDYHIKGAQWLSPMISTSTFLLPRFLAH